MHTPDGFITGWICVVFLVLAALLIGYSVFSARKWMTRQKALLMACLAAVIFAFQMLNFSIGNGTSGHFLGAAISAILLGPEAAVLILAAVLLVQAFVYGDGGVLALGVNIIVMGAVGGYSAHFVHASLKDKNKLVAGFVASFASVVAASLVAALLLGFSGTVAFASVIPAMIITHMFIGLGEGLITGSILLFVQKSEHSFSVGSGFSKYLALSTIAALLIISLALPFASQSPDGLEKVALNLGFYENAVTIYTIAPMQDYTFLGEESYLFVLFSGIVGMVLTFGTMYVFTKPLAIRN